MSEFDSTESERCQNSSHFLENNILNNPTRHTTVNTGPLEW